MREDGEERLEELFGQLIDSIHRYHCSDQIQPIQDAYQLAKVHHEGQKRKSGEPYIIHPLRVAMILADLKLDSETIAAALLHDLVEDTEITEEDIERQFGKEIMFLVRGVTKLDTVTSVYQADELQAANMKKILWAAAQDVRVIIIKLADRLHNMETLEYQSRAKQLKIAQETMDIYAPMAGHLGIIVVKKRLEDLCLRYLNETIYVEMIHKLEQIKRDRKQELDALAKAVAGRLKEAGIDGEVSIVYKHMFSVYRKMVLEKREIQELPHIFSVLVVVNHTMECYEAMGVLHNMATPIPGRFKDYIAMPKSNLYQSIHTTLMGKAGQSFEVQIRTREMDEAANYGILTKWKYREDRQDTAPDVSQKEKFNWLHELLRWQQDVSNSDYMEFVKKDLDMFSEKVYCFTPKGKRLELPKGSTAIDFAYYIHSEVGNHLSGARINGIWSEGRTLLHSGDIIEILTSDQKQVCPDWLGQVKTERARLKIARELSQRSV